MTFVIGWKDQGRVLLVTDSAVTKKEETRAGTTSLGQPYRETRPGHWVSDGAVKIRPIDKHLAIAFSGSVCAGRDFTAILERCRPQRSVADAVLYAGRHLVANASDLSLHVIAAGHENGTAQLITWSTNDPDSIVTDQDGAAMGSMPLGIRNLFAGLTKRLHRFPIRPSAKLALLLGGLHWHAINHDLMVHGVGGAFIGATTGPDGFQWQEDVAYLLYPANIAEIQRHLPGRGRVSVCLPV